MLISGSIPLLLELWNYTPSPLDGATLYSVIQNIKILYSFVNKTNIF